MLNSSAMFAAATAVMVAWSGSLTGAMAADGCETYGRLALQQQKQNESMKCGYSGSEWSSDLKAHVGWCSGVSPQDWQDMLKKRTQKLEECKSKS